MTSRSSGYSQKQCRTDRDRREVITARPGQVAVIPQEVGAELERLRLIGSILAILGVRPRQVLEVGKRLIEGFACIIGPACLVITIGKKTARSSQQKSILGHAGDFADDLLEVIPGLLEVGDRILDRFRSR